MNDQSRHFQQFSNKIRDKFNLKSREAWVLEQLYMTLNTHKGGFLVQQKSDFYLGIKVKSLKNDKFKVYLKDFRSKVIKKILINGRTLYDEKQNKVKIQWFGEFKELLKKNITPSFTILTSIEYRLDIPQLYLELIVENEWLIGDYCAYVAFQSKVEMKN